MMDEETKTSPKTIVMFKYGSTHPSSSQIAAAQTIKRIAALIASHREGR
jgi:hypothetical protein